ncbi:MAG: RIP metalloprotease [Candidatus Zixiibacteriota bacterium]
MFFTFIIFLITLSVLVLVHELGHFLAAKKMGIKVEEFGFGLPPRIWGKRKGETVYSINWLLIGGFVKLYGEEREEERIKDQRSKIKDINRAFYARPVWQRSIVLMAGVIMNFLLGIFIISFLFTQGVMVPTDRVHIEKVLIDTPAEQVGLKEGDVIKKFKVHLRPELRSRASSKFKMGKPQDTPEAAQRDSSSVEEVEIKKGEQLTKITKEHLGEKVILVIVREGKEQEVAIVPRKEYPKDQGPMGIVISNFEERKYSIWQAPILGTKEALILSFELLKGIGRTLFKLITLQPVAKDVAGPIGIAQMTGQAVKFGKLAVLELLGLLSLNLAIVNILPFPALDGGRLMFVLIEGATGKKIRATWERYLHQIGMAILLSLMALVAINDIIRIFSK